MIKLLNMDLFRYWLEQYDEGHIVGYTADPSHCPLATYMRDHGHEVLVSTDLIEKVGEIEQERLPFWVERFIHHVDDGDPDIYDEEVTAGRAMVCVEIVRSELKGVNPSPQVDQPIES